MGDLAHKTGDLAHKTGDLAHKTGALFYRDHVFFLYLSHEPGDWVGRRMYRLYTGKHVRFLMTRAAQACEASTGLCPPNVSPETVRQAPPLGAGAMAPTTS